MKNLPILILLLLAGCCEFDYDTVYSVDPRLEPYVTSFYDEANARGLPLRRNLIVRIEEVNAAGESFKQGGQRIVLISPNSYDYFTSGKWIKGDSAHYGMENLIFHELGHALLNRKHCDPCFSIMSEGISLFEYAKHQETRRRLIDELFNLTKSPQ